MTIHGVSIGDKFIKGKNLQCEVIDFIELISVSINKVIGYNCIAKSSNGVNICTFEIPFATVVRYKLSNK